MSGTGRVGKPPFVRHAERMAEKLGPIREARLRQRVRQQSAILEETTLHHLFYDRVIQIRNKISAAKDLREMMRLVRDTLQMLGAESGLGVCGYRYSTTTGFIWSATREKLQGDSRYHPDPALLVPGEKRFFIETAGERGYPGNPTDFLLVDRFRDFEKMSPEGRAFAEADLESDLVRYFGGHYREDFAGLLDLLKEALRYNLYIRWPGFDHYDLVIMANNHVHNAQLVKAGFPPEPLFRDNFVMELFLESLRDLQIPYTSKLREVENGRKAELRLLRGDSLHKLQTALDDGQTPQELFNSTLNLLPLLFPLSKEESYVERSSIMLFHAKDGRLSIVAARGLNEDIVKGTHLLPGENLAGRVFQTGQSILVLDAQAQQADVFLDRASLEKIAPGACMSVPIRSEGATYGVLNVRSRRIKAFREEELRFFETIAGILANKMRRLSLHQDIERIALYDERTGMFRPDYAEPRMRDMVEVARKMNLPLAYLLLDIDHFKNVNDGYGHQAGNLVLKSIARVIQDFIRDHEPEFQDHVESRWGGEEFNLCLLAINKKRALELAEELREKIKQNICDYYGEDIKVTVSIGIAIFPVHGRSADELFARADDTLYKVKENGRNQSQVFDPQDRRKRDSVSPSK